MGSPAFIPGDSAMYNKPPVLAGSYGRSASPAPSTGSAASSRHRRTDAPAADHGDYFDGPPRLGKNGSYRSLPGTPREALRRNISFSPRIQFHDVWSASDYDRRGDVATCNRLTPMLAQQIKEELNTFKMVSHGRQDEEFPMLTRNRKWKFTSCPRCTRTSSNVLICMIWLYGVNTTGVMGASGTACMKGKALAGLSVFTFLKNEMNNPLETGCLVCKGICWRCQTASGMMVNHECMHRQYSIKPLYLSLVSRAFCLTESLSTSESSTLCS